MGLEYGSEVVSGSILTGASMGELSGYTLSFVAQEVEPANFLELPTAADPYDGVSSSVTINRHL